MGKGNNSKSNSNSNNQKSNKKKKRRKKPGVSAIAATCTTTNNNFVSDAGPGCYIARRHDRDEETPSNDWMLEWEDVSKEEDFAAEEVPELAIDPDEKTLSVCNTRQDGETIIAYITVFETPVLGRHGQRLPMGRTTNNEGVTRDCVTFIVLCPPLVFAHLCFLDVPDDVDIFETVPLESDVQEWNRHPHPDDEHPWPLAFPLRATTQQQPQQQHFLCTQGEGGQLTHFFSGNLHAIDFQCPVGTPLVAAGDGRVVEVKDQNTLTGIAVSNLFEWNTILLQLDTSAGVEQHDNNNNIKNGPLFVEYVHIQKSLVQEGDRVTKGQVIGKSGSVGFSPEPHLHFAAYRSKDAEAPTVRVRFQTDNAKQLFLPQAGNYYNTNGEVKVGGRQPVSS